MNSVSAVEHALSPATPPDVTDAARRFVRANLELTTAATGLVPIDEVIRLNATANQATYALADVCGLPH